ncbi:PadR family transcriptional regulator [Streptococcus rubneri]|uniref:PadR family transcriptional regulator n=1 Tax=Streptococcus TaxID=1301 RepID=UPI000E441169|nr:MULTISPECIES: PadR family transcriptional regulator [Streptococcus]QXW97327.1 PadR family transcriptional regulator [Streptococcus rubneri]RGM72378.1 PadR family transcriptional regulator [Streptococcus ilei]
MKESQLLKGVLEGCVLEIISKKSIYGYELIQSLKETGFDKIVAGTVYPLLQKLEKQGVIVGEMRPSPGGPDRKYFSLTMEGRERLEEFWYQWQDLVIKVERVKKEGKAI